MPTDRRVDRLSSDRSRSSPYPWSSKNTEHFKTQGSLGSDENIQKWENVKCPVPVDHRRDKGDERSLRSTKDVKEWEEIRCPICMEHPHNAVLLQCSSFGKGCRPHMCNTSYRHANCLDQFRKSNLSSPSVEILHETPAVSNRTGGELQALGQTGHKESEPQPKLWCPLCRGQIYGWTVVKPAREFMNSKVRSCSWEICDFSGSYSELRKHARSDHPFIRPSEVDIHRKHDWDNFEYERDVADIVATLGLTREEQEELGRDFDDLPAMVSPNEEEDEENEDRNRGDSYQVGRTSNLNDRPVVLLRFELEMSPEDHDMETSHNRRQTNNFRWNRNMSPSGYESGASYSNRRTNNNFRRNNSSRSNVPERMLHDLNSHSHANRRTNNTRWNSSSRNNDPERMRHGLNSHRQNDGFSRNGNNFRWNRNMSPSGYERGASYSNSRTNNNFRRNNSSRSNVPERMLHDLNSHSHTNRRTNNTRWNRSSRNNDPERMRHGLNSHRQNDGFSRNGNLRGNGNFWSNRTERNQRRRSDSFRPRTSERTP